MEHYAVVRNESNGRLLDEGLSSRFYRVLAKTLRPDTAKWVIDKIERANQAGRVAQQSEESSGGGDDSRTVGCSSVPFTEDDRQRLVRLEKCLKEDRQRLLRIEQALESLLLMEQRRREQQQKEEKGVYLQRLP